MGPLALAFGRNEGLQTIILSGNCIGDEGACLIADALEDNPNGPLRTLDLHDNCIGDEGAANIAEVLGTENKSLTTIDFRNQRERLGGDDTHPVPVGAPVDTEGIMAFAAMLKTNSTLTSMNRGNGLDLERTARVVATDAFAKLLRQVYNPRACIPSSLGMDFARSPSHATCREVPHPRSQRRPRSSIWHPQICTQNGPLVSDSNRHAVDGGVFKVVQKMKATDTSATNVSKKNKAKSLNFRGTVVRLCHAFAPLLASLI